MSKHIPKHPTSESALSYWNCKTCLWWRFCITHKSIISNVPENNTSNTVFKHHGQSPAWSYALQCISYRPHLCANCPDWETPPIPVLSVNHLYDWLMPIFHLSPTLYSQVTGHRIQTTIYFLLHIPWVSFFNSSQIEIALILPKGQWSWDFPQPLLWLKCSITFSVLPDFELLSF